jgi:hypothetical protein
MRARVLVYAEKYVDGAAASHGLFADGAAGRQVTAAVLGFVGFKSGPAAGAAPAPACCRPAPAWGAGLVTGSCRRTLRLSCFAQPLVARLRRLRRQRAQRST